MNANGFNTLTCPNNIPDFNATGGPIAGSCQHIKLGSNHNVTQGNYFGLNKDGNRTLGGYCLNGQRPPGTTALPCTTADAIFSIGRSAIFVGGPPIGVASGISVDSDASLSNGYNVLGGLSPKQGNVISGALSQAVNIAGPKTLVLGNIIGLDASGMTNNNVTGSRSTGIRMSNASWGNIVMNNIVADSDLFTNTNNVGIGGIELNATVQNLPKGPYDNIIKNNIIGTNRDGTLTAGNLQGGIVLIGDISSSYIIGNTVKFNGINSTFAGVILQGRTVSSVNLVPSGITMLNNSISSNAGLGIDLNPIFYSGNVVVGNGLTANDAMDVDAGPNNGQNFPILTEVKKVHILPVVTVKGSLNSIPNTYFLLQFFANDAAKAQTIEVVQGMGPQNIILAQGKNYLGSWIVKTDANGNRSFTALALGLPALLPNCSIDSGAPGKSCITATATRLDVNYVDVDNQNWDINNIKLTDTSELSPAVILK